MEERPCRVAVVATWKAVSLSQLTSATNPESGYISYSHDPNGNLASKTAPAPNQLGTATVTTTYTYDALNRLTSKVYNNGSPSVLYWYDQTARWGITLTNPIGRLTGAGTYDGTCYPTASTFGYDTMGRPSFQEDYLNKAETSGCPGAWSTISATADSSASRASLAEWRSSAIPASLRCDPRLSLSRSQSLSFSRQWKHREERR